MYKPSHFTLHDQVAVITGAGAGIDRAIAETFATAGAAVMISDRDAATAKLVAEAIQKNGSNAAAMACDVTQESDLSALVQQTTKRFGKLSILVSNAGGGGGGPKPFDMPIADFKRAFDLNVFSLFRLAQIAAPEMEKSGGGAILAITSMAGENKNRRMAS